ncbi:hypothetical protein STH12_03874 [Shewanella khirikhana]|uniref:Uncharacterized protein n=1 Tax=Shewanella khirikhana TaxID=1965282 RepID=A0ABM7DT87_9GAMM|nr:hypothetical protein STH12_03874 [Shewanella khirikhana]
MLKKQFSHLGLQCKTVGCCAINSRGSFNLNLGSEFTEIAVRRQPALRENTHQLAIHQRLIDALKGGVIGRFALFGGANRDDANMAE